MFFFFFFFGRFIPGNAPKCLDDKSPPRHLICIHGYFQMTDIISKEVLESRVPLLIRQQGGFMFHESEHSSVTGQVGGLVVRHGGTRRDRLAFIEHHYAQKKNNKKPWILTNK